MRNLLINLTFIFILVLGGASDAIAQKTEASKADGGIIDILFATAVTGGGIIDILHLQNNYDDDGGNRLANDVSKIKVNISTLDNVNLIEHIENYTYSDMQITLPIVEVKALPVGTYLLSVSIEGILIGQKEIQIE